MGCTAKYFLHPSPKMKRLLFLLLFLPSLLRADYYLSDVPYNNEACRRAFLLGMGNAQGSLLGKGGFYGFWDHEEEAWKVFIAVAKLYAVDIGVSPERLATDAWEADVAVALARKGSLGSLREIGGPEVPAYVAGAYARWGTPTGLRLNSSQAYQIAEYISFLNDFNLQLNHTAGYPGGYTITITEAGAKISPKEFFATMQKIKADVQKPVTPAPAPDATAK